MLVSNPSLQELAEILVDYSEVLLLLFESSKEQQGSSVRESLQLIHRLATGIAREATYKSTPTYLDQETQTTTPAETLNKSPYSTTYSSSISTTIDQQDSRYSSHPWLWDPDTSSPDSFETAAYFDAMNFKIRLGSASERSRLASSDGSSTVKSWAEIELEKAKARREQDIEIERQQRKEEKRKRKLEKRLIQAERWRRRHEAPPVFREPVWDGSTAVNSPNSKSSKFGNMFTYQKPDLIVRPPEFSPNISPRTTMPLQRANSVPSSRFSLQFRRGLQPLVLPTPLALPEEPKTGTSSDVVSPAKSLMTFFTNSNGSSSAGKSSRPRLPQLRSARVKIRHAIDSITRRTVSTSDVPQIYVAIDDSPDSDETRSPASPYRNDPDAGQLAFLESDVLRQLPPSPGRPLPVRKASSSATITPATRMTHSEVVHEMPEETSQPTRDSAAGIRRISGPTSLLPKKGDFDAGSESDAETERELEGFRDRNRGAFAPNFKRRPSAPRPSFDEPGEGPGWGQHPGTPWPREQYYNSPTGQYERDQYFHAIPGQYDMDEGPYRGGRLAKSASVPRRREIESRRDIEWRR